MAQFTAKWFPLSLFIAQGALLVLFGTLVEYDFRGSPDHRLSELEDALEHSGEEGSTRGSVLLGVLPAFESSQSVARTYPLFQDVHVMIFVGFGFLMTFMRRYGYGSVGFNMLLASFAIQWSTITNGLFTFIEQAQEGLAAFRIRVNIETMVGSDFAAAAVLITMGAVLGRASPFQLIIIAFFELMCYSANEALNIHVFQAADVGGSMIIHTFGAYFGIAVSLVLYNKKASEHPRNSASYHSDLFAMIGTLFLWLFWPSFNGALATGNSQYRAIINTYFSMTGSVVSTYIFAMFFNKERKISMTLVQNATLAGGVAVGSVADMVIQPWGAMFIGFAAGFISVLGYQFLSPFLERRLRLQDTCGVHNLHGLPGIFSGLISALAAALAEETGALHSVFYGTSLFLVFPARAPANATDITRQQSLLGVEAGEGRHAGTQAGFQLALLASSLFISIVGGLITGVIVRFVPFFNATKENEFYDDDPYWELPDDADQYLPVPSDPSAQQQQQPWSKAAEPRLNVLSQTEETTVMFREVEDIDESHTHTRSSPFPPEPAHRSSPFPREPTHGTSPSSHGTSPLPREPIHGTSPLPPDTRGERP